MTDREKIDVFKAKLKNAIASVKSNKKSNITKLVDLADAWQVVLDKLEEIDNETGEKKQ